MKRYLVAATLGLATILGLANLALAQAENDPAPPSAKSAAVKKPATSRKTKTAKKTEAKQAEAKEKTKLEIATFGGG